MKDKIHPKYEKSIVSCSCGNTFETKSTVPEISIDICSVCHPFYTGKQKLVDTAGRVDKFRSRLQKMEELKNSSPKQKATPKKDLSVKKEKKIETIADIKKELEVETIDADVLNNK